MKIERYNTYIFDIMNTLDQKDSLSDTSCVQVINIHRKVFKQTTYDVVCLNTSRKIRCDGSLLTPIPNNDTAVCIRNPTDMPRISDKEIKELDCICNYLEKNDKQMFLALYTISLKLKFYNGIRKVSENETISQENDV